MKIENALADRGERRGAEVQAVGAGAAPGARRHEAIVPPGKRDELCLELRRRGKAVVGGIAGGRRARNHVPRDFRAWQVRAYRAVAGSASAAGESIAAVLRQVVGIDELQ